MGNAIPNVIPADFLRDVWDQKPSSSAGSKTTSENKKESDSVSVRVDLPDKSSVVLIANLTQCTIEPVCQETKVAFAWAPVSTMHEPVVLAPLTPPEIKVARGQSIGVLIIESMQAYAKITYDEYDRNGVKIVYKAWERSDKYRNRLNEDLWLGYDVCYLVAGETKPWYLKGMSTHQLSGL